MISAVTFLVVWIRAHLRKSRKPQKAPWDSSWAAFQHGRRCDERRDTQGAFRAYLVAAQGGLPVAAVMAWMAYRVGHGAHADPIACHAWARQAMALGWPEGVLEPVVGDDLHGRPPC